VDLGQRKVPKHHAHFVTELLHEFLDHPVGFGAGWALIVGVFDQGEPSGGRALAVVSDQVR
jgi:hypothetical protein